MIKSFYPVQFYISPNFAHTKGRRRPWHTIIAVGQLTRLDYVRRGMPSWTLGNIDGKMTSAVAMPLSLLECTHDQTSSGVACHHRPWKAYMIGQHRAWRVIIAHWQHTWLDNVANEMLWSFINTTHDRITSGMECPHGPWETHTVGLC